MTPWKSSRLQPPDRLRYGAIALRLPRDSDLAAIVAACQDPEIPRWTRAPNPYRESDGREFLHACEESWREETGVVFAVTWVEEDALIGTIGARLLENQVGEVGYWVDRAARGRGVAPAAVRALSDWCFLEAGLERLQLLAEPENVASQRVAEKAGYQREGLLRSYFPNKGTRRDVLVYSLLPDDLIASNQEAP